MHIRISLDTEFQLKIDNFDFLDQFCSNRVFPIENKKRKSEHDHWILHNWTSLGTKIQLKLTFLIFWTKFARKRYLRYETEKSHFCVRPWSLLNYIKRFRTGADRHNGILMSLLLPSRYKKQRKILQTIMFIIFWDFLMIEEIFRSPQMKRSVIISNKLVYASCLNLRLTIPKWKICRQ